jgi:hypothetical protein
MQQYASIAVIKSITKESTAIEVISVTPDSCDLAGAWILDNSDHEKLIHLLIGRLIIKLELDDGTSKKISQFNEFVIDFADFISEAKHEAEIAEKSYFDFMKRNEEEYRAFMAIKPAERKLIPQIKKKQLIEPQFYSWPTRFDVLDSKSFLKSINKVGLLSNEDSQMADVLIAARATKYLIDKWREDEIERSNRLYVEGQDANVSILPLCWLEKIN